MPGGSIIAFVSAESGTLVSTSEEGCCSPESCAGVVVEGPEVVVGGPGAAVGAETKTAGKLEGGEVAATGLDR